MGLIPSAPDYAESHFKFRLPFSRLFRKAPEMLVDAPFQVQRGLELPFWLVVRDANRFPRRLLGFDGVWKRNGQERHFHIECDKRLDQAFHFESFTLTPPAQPGLWWIDISFQTETPQGKTEIHHRWNYPGLPVEPLLVQVLAHALPTPPSWVGGETHCHTWHSSDPVEFGASPIVLHQAAAAVGLDYVFLSDHSYDFAWEQGDYMRAADPVARFSSLCAEVASLPTSGPLLLAGEEVSCGNHLGQNVHLLAPHCPQYIPGQGDGGRRWFSNQPDLSIAEVLQRVPSPCFAAHPKVPMGRLERMVFRRGDWHEQDLGPNLRGLQFFNGSQDQGYELGKAFWISMLQQGRHLLPIGGNDAHGDLNGATGVKTPLWSLKHSRKHVFGRVRTFVPLTEATRNAQNLLDAFQGDQAFISDGPSLWWVPNADRPILRFASTPDQGSLQTIVLYIGSHAEEQSKQLPNANQGCLNCEWNIDLPVGGLYLRAECYTESGRHALTAAYWPK